jgi:hypothetical protein
VGLTYEDAVRAGIGHLHPDAPGGQAAPDAGRVPATPGRYQVTVPGHPPTLNSLMRGRLRCRMKLGRAWKSVAVKCCRDAGIPPARCKRRVRATVVLGPGQRGADPDAYQKALGDSLKAAGALKDDSRFWVEWWPVDYRRGDSAATVLVLEDMA